MLALVGSLALAQTAPCDDPPEEKPVVKCDAETTGDAGRKIDLAALLGAPTPAVDPGCARTTLVVVSGSPIGVEDRLTAVDDALRSCATAARKRNRALSGATAFTIEVDEQGKVTDIVERSSTLTDQVLVDCFARTLGTARFTAARRVLQVGVGCRAPES